MPSDPSRPPAAFCARLCSKYVLDKSIGMLAGLLDGITIDRVLVDSEVAAVRGWLSEHVAFADRHPFNEIMPRLVEALKDGKITKEERQDLVWLCDRITNGAEKYDAITADIQHLHGLLAGLLADGKITKDELVGLRDWQDERQGLLGVYPYDEVRSLITSVLADGVVDDEEQQQLIRFFGQFVGDRSEKVLGNPEILVGGTLQAVCAACPEISFSGKVFCFTGESSRVSRSELESLVERHDGKASRTVTRKVDYLVVGDEGNDCWAFSCYGRKVEKAIELRKAGGRILIVHENDFWDAAADAGEEPPRRREATMTVAQVVEMILPSRPPQA